MLRVLAKFNCVTVLLPLVVSQYVNTSKDVRLPNKYEEIIFRVQNGIPAKLGTVPYQISIKAPERWNKKRYVSFCGGALIASNKILSAAHCFTRLEKNRLEECCNKIPLRKIERFYIVAAILTSQGTYKKDGESSEQWRSIRSAHIEPNFLTEKPKNDIAVAFTYKPFVFNDNVKALPYATKDMDYEDDVCIISGYGRINLEESSDILLYANVKLLSKPKCSRLHGRNMNSFVCIDVHSEANTGRGDSGGPMVCKNTGDKMDTGDGVIVGVICGASRPLHTYQTRVSDYQDFIRKKATNNLPVFDFVWISLVITHFG